MTNQLQIFKSLEHDICIRGDVSRGKRYFVNGEEIDRFELLAIALEEKEKEKAWSIMNVASELFHPLDDYAFNAIYGAVAMEITRKNTKNECYYHALFKKHASKLLSDATEVIDMKSNGKDIPDAWVKDKNNLMPVEIKKNDFNKRALAQLQRYMRIYSCAYGIACGRGLAVELPGNILFISLNELEKEEDKYESITNS